MKTLRALRTLRTLCALRALRTLRALCALRTLRALSLSAPALVLALSATVLTGCPERSSGGSGGGGPPKTCTRLAEQCTLPSGSLGVCSETPCPPGREPPCLACTSQH